MKERTRGIDLVVSETEIPQRVSNFLDEYANFGLGEVSSPLPEKPITICDTDHSERLDNAIGALRAKDIIDPAVRGALLGCVRHNVGFSPAHAKHMSIWGLVKQKIISPNFQISQLH